MKISEVLSFLEEKYPLHYQEDFDNCGVQCGDKDREITGVLVCFEMSEETIDEAIRRNANLVISHHPLILRKGIFKIEPTNRVGRIICKALEHRMVLYSMHTNLDSAEGGVNDTFASKLGLDNVKVLSPIPAGLCKIAFFVPADYAEHVCAALFEVGCGKLGNYEHCAYKVAGRGTFRPTDGASPFIGTNGETETVVEERIEMVFPSHLQKKVVAALYAAHPYEEPAFDLFRLENTNCKVGLGRIGDLPTSVSAEDFLLKLKEIFGLQMIRFYGDLRGSIRRVAVLGGGGSSFIGQAMAAGADVYVTGDVKYHDFHSADRKMLIVDIGHFESEHFIKEIIFKELKENFNTFAVSLAESEKMQISVL